MIQRRFLLNSVTDKKIIDIFKELKTSQDGLKKEEIEKRFLKYGPNKLPEEKPISRIWLFLFQIQSPLIYILIIASLITLLLKDYTDSIVIFAAVLINIIIGYIQESKASRALGVLKKILKIKAIVIRDGSKKQILQEDIVPGDIIILQSGDRVPADGRLLSAKDLKIDESVLTGEWLAAKKSTKVLKKDTPLADQDNMVFMGTAVESGSGIAIVTATGPTTQIGKVAKMLKETKDDKTPYQKKLSGLSRTIGIVIGVLSLFIFIQGIITGGQFIEIFITAIAVAVAAIPEGLPVAMTVILALGMQRILKKKGLVRQLVSAETLGSTSVICTDKTGTLTKGKMSVTGIYTGEGSFERINDEFFKKIIQDCPITCGKVLKIAFLRSDAFVENPNDDTEKWQVRGRPTDRALFLAGAKIGLEKKELEAKEEKIDEIPFNSTHKFSASLHQYSDKSNILYILGAPEKIIDKVKFIDINGKKQILSKEKLNEFHQKLRVLASQGLRVVATAYKMIEKNKIKIQKSQDQSLILSNLVFTGFISLNDPLREEAKEAIQICQKAGIRPIIVTGDHKLTTQAIVREIGLSVNENNIIEGGELARLSDADFKKRVKDIGIYARVEPAQKLRIIQAWQEQGEVVAMTGDGINDAPALKKADIGLALGSGTQVAKEVSDLVLLDDNFSVVVAAVEQGRSIIDNIRKVITYLLSDSFSEVILIGTSLILGWPLPILAAQILWVNLIEDSLPNMALAFEPKEKDLIDQKPHDRKQSLLTSDMKILIFIIGIATDLLLLVLFYWLFKFSHYEIEHIRSIIFAGLAISSLFFVFSCKSLRKNIWQINPFSNNFLIISWILGIFALIIALYLPVFQTFLRTRPLNFFDWGLLLILGIINLVLIEATKWYLIARKKEI